MRTRIVTFLRRVALPCASGLVCAAAMFFALSNIFSVCGPLGISYHLSWELWGAPCAPTVKQRVALWLRVHERNIVKAERTYAVDRRAIAGAIAYEGLTNFHPSDVFGLTRSEGPGKVHYKQFYFAEGDPAARQVEQMGLLPRLSVSQRRKALRSPDQAIQYIAAIMHAESVAMSRVGYDLQCKPAVLVTLYTGWTPQSVKYGLSEEVHSPENLVPNAAGNWVSMMLYLAI